MKKIIILVFTISINVQFSPAPAGNVNIPREPATFSFNFLPMQGAEVFAACGVGDLPVGMGAKGSSMCGDDGGGPGGLKGVWNHEGYVPSESMYLLEQYNDIFHQVMIEPSQGFSMEIYIRTPGGTAGLTQARAMSGGKNDNHIMPLGDMSISGTGTGDPQRVIYKMRIEDIGFIQETFKAQFDRKPYIYQVAQDAEIVSHFEMDMTNSSYQEMNTPAIMVVNTLEFTDFTSFLNFVDAEFDMAQDIQNSEITGGRFKITTYYDATRDPGYDYIDAPDDYGKDLPWLDYWHGSRYWQPGDSYPDPLM